MQEKQGRMLTWMAGVLVVLVGVVVLGESEEEEPEEGEESWQPAFPDVERSAVDAMTIDDGASSVSLARADGGWALTAPFAAEADAAGVQSLLGTLEDMECGDDLESSALADYGLAPPKWTVTLTVGEATHTVRIGTASPVGGRTYVQCSDEAVRTTRARLSDVLSASADDFRSRSIATFPVSALTELRITLPVVTDAEVPAAEAERATLVAQRTPAGWRDAATGALLNGEKVRTMAEAMTGASVERFDAEPPMPPLIELVAVADGQEHALAYGINGTARVPLQDAPVTLAGEFPIPAEVDAMLATGLMEIDPVMLTELSVSLDGRSVVATREANGWSHPAAEGLLGALLEVRVDRRQEAPPPAAEVFGTLTLTDSNGQALTVTLHQDVEGQRVVSDAAGGPPFLLPATEVARLLSALAE